MKTQVVVCLLLSGVVMGCSGGATNRDPVYKVSGVVTYQGKPVPSADVTFFNKDLNRSAFGRTDETGAYELTTFSSNDGAVAGKHAVAIAKVVVPPDLPTLAATDTAEYAPPEENMSTDPVRPKSELPEKYAVDATSGLIAVVNADGENVINFDLK